MIPDYDGSGAVRLIVTAELSGVRLEDFLGLSWPDADRRFWRRAVRERAITVNEDPVHSQQRLRTGDVVALELDLGEIPLHRQPTDDEPVGDDVPVVFENDAVLVVDKPAGMHTVPDRGGKYLGVHGLLRAARPDDDLRIVHRLDVGTSGCLIVAKGLESARFLDRAFRAGEVHKEYLALVEGVVRRSPLELDGAIGPDSRRPGRMKIVAPRARGARESLTVVEIEEAFRGHTCVRAFPKTGRSHQIRVHLREAGHRIAGDRDYGSGQPLLLSEIKPNFKTRPGRQEKPLLQRMFLHSEIVELVTHEGGERVRVQAPLPRELELVMDKLRRFAPPRR